MGIFDFFKKSGKSKTKKDKIKKPDFTEIQEKEKNLSGKITFSEIEDFVSRKDQINREKENLYLDYLERKKQEFIHNLYDQIETLRNVDLEYKKAKTNNRVKGIVQQNKDKYIQYTEEIIEKLNNFEKTGIENFINKANKIFEEFHKKSYTNYEKTTVLVGKEIADIKNSIKTFSHELLRSFNENKNLINEIKILSEIKSKYSDINNIDSELKDADERINYFEKEIDKKNKEREKILENIEKIKNSEKYKERLDKQQKIKELQKNRDNLILLLKQKIDFKRMANFFHIFPEKIKTVKEHKENFSKKFKENKKEIIDLLEEAGMKSPEILGLFEKIKNKEKALEEVKESIPEDETSGEYYELDKIDAEIDNLKKEKSEKENRKNNLKENKQNLKDSLKSDFNKLSVELSEK